MRGAGALKLQLELKASSVLLHSPGFARELICALALRVYWELTALLERRKSTNGCCATNPAAVMRWRPERALDGRSDTRHGRLAPHEYTVGATGSMPRPMGIGCGRQQWAAHQHPQSSLTDQGVGSMSTTCGAVSHLVPV